MLEVEETKVWRIPEKFVLYRLDDKLCWIFDTKDGDYFELNSTSYFILSCFDGKKSFSKIRDQVISEYPEVNPQEIYIDLDELVKKMVREGILEIV